MQSTEKMEKIQATSLAKYFMKLDLHAGYSVMDDRIRFESDRSSAPLTTGILLIIGVKTN